MYPCSSCGRILASQQNLNYHLSHKPNTCEKYLRKLANQQKKAAMETLSSPKPSSQVAPATQTTVASLSSATKIVGNDMSTSSLPKPSSQVARTIAPATQTAAAKSAVGDTSATQTTSAPATQTAAAKSAVGTHAVLGANL